MGATTSRAITRPLAAWSGTVSISATGVTRSRMMRSTSSTGNSGPEKAKQSSVSCAITRAPHAPARLGSARRAGSEGRRCARRHRDQPPERARPAAAHRTPRRRSPSHRGEAAVSERGTVHFELGMGLALVPFDQHEIDRTEFGEQGREPGFGLSAQLVNERPTVRRADQNFGRPDHAVGVGILAGLVDVEAMMGVLERRYLKSPRDDAGNDLGEERGLAGAAPAGEADDAHAAL